VPAHGEVAPAEVLESRDAELALARVHRGGRHVEHDDKVRRGAGAPDERVADARTQLLAPRGQQGVVGVAVEHHEPTAAALVAAGETLGGELGQPQHQHEPGHAPQSPRALGGA
jgi:hypothetical protein